MWFIRKTPICVVVVLLGMVMLKAGVPQPGSGTWSAASPMSQARTGASAVLLADGRILITGGDGAAGPVSSAEVFDTGGAFSSVAPMKSPRSRHASVALQDGRVLITGGTTTGVGGVTNDAEIYDPANNTWSAAGVMTQPHSGHTATLLSDGRVLIAGGDSAGGPTSTVEVFSPADNSFSFAGALSSPRMSHAAAALPDGRVLIVGGSNGTVSLASSDIYDPATGSISAGPQLGTPRAGLSATTLLTGDVLIVGGNRGSTDLGSAEIYSANSFAPAGSLTTPRNGHLGFLLPANNSVLIVGGTSAGVPLASAELFFPWSGSFRSTGSMAVARSGAVGAALNAEGRLLVTGGGSATAEVYGFATIKTDKGDYAPGEIVTITGSGWQPGETVALFIHEIPDVGGDKTFTSTADAFGNIYNNQYSPEPTDVGFHYFLTATGSVSQAQTAFFDGTPKVDSVTNSIISPNQSSSTGIKDTTDITVKNQGGGGVIGIVLRIRSGTALAGTLVREISIGTLAGNASSTKTWDGKDNSSNFVAEGSYTARAFSPSNGENDANNDKQTIVVDNTNPTVTIGPPADNVFVSGNLTLNASPLDAGGNDNNIQKVEFYVDGTLNGTTNSASGGVWNISLNTNNPPLADGPHSWFVKAFDDAGNNTQSSTRTLKVDNTQPVVAVDPISNGTIGTAITVTGTASDPNAPASVVASVVVTISRTSDGTVLATGPATNTGTNFNTWSFSYTPTEATGQNAVAKATDNAGNFKNSAPANFTVSSANTAPTLGLTGSTTANTGDTKIYTFTVTDPGDTFTAKSGFPDCGAGTVVANSLSTNASGGSFQCSFATAAGNTSVRMQVTDSHSADSNIATVAVSVNQIPSVSLAGPAAPNQGETKTYNFTVTDSSDTYTVKTGFPDCGTGTVVANSLSGTASGGSFQCSFGTAGNTSVRMQVTDSHSADSNIGSLSVTVNQAPTVVITGPAAADEGQTKSYSFTVTDDLGDTFTVKNGFPDCGIGGTLVSNSLTTNAAGGSFQCTFPDGPASLSVRIQVTDSHSDDSNISSQAVTVSNLAPTVGIQGAPATSPEGTQIGLTSSVTDPSSADTAAGFTYSWSITKNNNSFGSGANSSLTFTPDDNGTYVVTLSATDKDGGKGIDTKTITVTNVAPTASILGAPVTSPEGTPLNLNSSVTDPSTADTAAGFTVNWSITKDGNPFASGTGNMPSFTPDDNATYVVSLSATDKDGGKGTETKTINVLNVPPTVQITGAPLSSPEGTSISLGSVITDPSSVDTAAGFSNLTWSVTKNGVAYATGSGAGYSFIPNDDASYVVTFSASDKDGGVGTTTAPITVFNVLPIITGLSIGPTTINENGLVTVSATFTDPGLLDPHTATITWGDGTPTLATITTSAPGAFGFTASHQYLDDNPTGTTSDVYPIGISITDDDGATTAGQNITVNNVSPVLGIVSAPSGPTPVNTSFNISAPFTDVGTLDTHTCSFSWDDAQNGLPATVTAGAIAEPSGTAVGKCSTSHTYNAAGVYTIGISVTDDDTGVASTNYQYVVVYDPSAGFVTGGGWIYSPAGAYTLNLALAGKATFGFVSKYQKGANVPVGETEFQFQVASFNFHSTVYEWLVISGAKAQYKGSGTVNGTGDYGFLLTATDGQLNGGGGLDKFRIKIWDKATSVVIYDNAPSASDDIDLVTPQVISGGSIVIHK